MLLYSSRRRTWEDPNISCYSADVSEGKTAHVRVCSWPKWGDRDEILVDTSQWIRWKEIRRIRAAQRERECVPGRRGRKERPPGQRKAPPVSRGAGTPRRCPVPLMVSPCEFLRITAQEKIRYHVVGSVFDVLLTCCCVMSLRMICCVQLCSDLISLTPLPVQATREMLKELSLPVFNYIFRWPQLRHQRLGRGRPADLFGAADADAGGWDPAAEDGPGRRAEKAQHLRGTSSRCCHGNRQETNRSKRWTDNCLHLHIPDQLIWIKLVVLWCVFLI